ncbi:MAG: type 1 periplasmic binding fold superfamily protein [Bacteroidota bacterium]
MKIFSILSIVLALTFIGACKKKKKEEVTNPPVVNEEELITTFRITFTDAGGVQPTVIAQFVDLDGAGGNAPTIFDTIRLQANTTYNASITLLNESVNPAEDLTVEVQEEDQDHLFCFSPTGSLNLGITRTDSDGTYEVGLLSSWAAQAISTGETTITLKHQPGVKNGQCDPGETDIELTFHTIIE